MGGTAVSGASGHGLKSWAEVFGQLGVGLIAEQDPGYFGETVGVSNIFVANDLGDLASSTQEVIELVGKSTRVSVVPITDRRPMGMT